jgi:DNA modification methylase
MKDFRGEVIRLMQSYGWIYYSEVTINKNPQIKAIRTRDATLSFRDLVSDSANSRPAMADYLLIFKKPGKNNNPVHSGSIRKYDSDGWINDIEWIEWAHPVWNDIIETDTLNYRNGRDSSDEKHLCPLQLSVIERCVKLYTNPNEIVFSPFMGIGSEGYESLLLGRKFIGIELKNSYFDQSNINLKLADKKFGSKHIIHNLKKDKNLNNFFK